MQRFVLTLFAGLAMHAQTQDLHAVKSVSSGNLSDFAAAPSSAQTLAIGVACSVLAPCAARIGEVTYIFKAPATASVSGSGTNVAGVAFIYISSTGVLTAGSSDLALTCSGCAAVVGTTQFPPASIPLFTWTVSAGSWDATGGVDFRASFSNKSIISGMGIVAVTASGQTEVSVDSSSVGLRVAPPASSTAPCAGAVYAIDPTYFYQCVGPNKWARVAWSATTW